MKKIKKNKKNKKNKEKKYKKAVIICTKTFRKKRQKYTSFFISDTFISNTKLKLAENQAKPEQHPEAELLLSENSSLSSILVIIQK